MSTTVVMYPTGWWGRDEESSYKTSKASRSHSCRWWSCSQQTSCIHWVCGYVVYNTDTNRECYQHSHNANFHWNFQKYLAEIISLTECLWEFPKKCIVGYWFTCPIYQPSSVFISSIIYLVAWLVLVVVTNFNTRRVFFSFSMCDSVLTRLRVTFLSCYGRECQIHNKY